MSWKRIAKLLSAQFGKECVWKQCSNHDSKLKTTLIGWDALHTQYTSLEFDPYTQCPLTTDKDR